MADRPDLLIDGQPARALPADDRGLAYGDGVFRTLLVVAGRITAFGHQMARLEADCERLALTAPSRETIAADIETLCDGTGSFVVKIMVTRGSGGRGYTPPEAACCRRLVSRHAYSSTTDEALTLSFSEIMLGEQPALAGIKHLNRLEQVLARAECRRRNVADLAMCDAGGRLIATTMRNLILADAEQRWYTPSLTRCGIAGATRARLMDSRSQQGCPITVCDIVGTDLSQFVAAIACNSVTGAIAVSAIGRACFDASPSMAVEANRLLEATA